MKKLYFGHSKRLFGSKQEAEVLQILKKFFPPPGWLIVDPSKLKFPAHEDPVAAYLLVVKKCNLLVLHEFKEHIGRGCFRELQAAEENDIPAYVLRQVNGNYKLFKVQAITIVDEIDYIIRFAKITQVSEI